MILSTSKNRNGSAEASTWAAKAPPRHTKVSVRVLALACVLFLTGFFWRPGMARWSAGETPSPAFKYFSLFADAKYSTLERGALLIVLGIAVAGLGYALMLVRQVNHADAGTEKMQAIAAAVREGANAYLAAQFRKIGLLIVAITALLYFTYTGSEPAFGAGRAAAFLAGSLFSWTVGFVGMR